MKGSSIKFLWVASAFLMVSWLGAHIMTAIGNERSQITFLEHSGDPYEEIGELEWQTLLERIVIRRNGEDAWHLISPEDYPANIKEVDRIIGMLASAQIEERMSVRKENLADFSLEEGQGIRLLIRDRLGKPMLDGRLGKPVTGSYNRSYFAFGKSNEVFIVNIPRYEFDQKSVLYKDRLILKTKEESIDSIIISRNRRNIKLSKGKGGWLVNGRAGNQEKVTDIVRSFYRFESVDFATPLEVKRGSRRLGLTRAPKTLSITINLKDGKSYKLLVGNKYKKVYFAKLTSKPTIWRLPEWQVDRYKITAKSLLASKRK